MKTKTKTKKKKKKKSETTQLNKLERTKTDSNVCSFVVAMIELFYFVSFHLLLSLFISLLYTLKFVEVVVIVVIVVVVVVPGQYVVAS